MTSANVYGLPIEYRNASARENLKGIADCFLFHNRDINIPVDDSVAKVIKGALDALDLDNIDFLVIENVGNLVCPAEFEIGEDTKIAVLSTTEGNDKLLKYPLMFEKSEAVILNKIDLLEFTNFSKEEFYKDIQALNANAKVFETSCVKEQGVEELCQV